MNKYLLYLPLLGIVFLYGLIAGSYKTFPFNEIKTLKRLVLGQTNDLYDISTPYYLSKVSFFKLNSKNNYDIVFIGDSLTDNAEWHDLFLDVSIANRGISGDRSAGILNRMDTIISTGAKKAFLMLGVNDINRGINIDLIFDNYKKIIIELQENNIEPYVQSTLFTDLNSIDNHNIEELNLKLKAFCKKKSITFIDLNPLLSKSGRLSKNYSFDGLHLNGKGYSVWSQAIYKYIN